jgi:hypothetical protein
MNFHKVLGISIVAALVAAASAYARDQPAFIAVYAPQYVVTSVKTAETQTKAGDLVSPWLGFSGGGFTGDYFVEVDASGAVASLLGKGDSVDGGLLDARLGLPIFGHGYAVGAAAIVDIHMMSSLNKDGWTGLGALVFSSFALGKQLYFLPKVGYILTGMKSSHDDCTSSILLECGIGLRLSGVLGLALQPSYDLRDLRDGTANRFALRVGLGILN